MKKYESLEEMYEAQAADNALGVVELGDLIYYKAEFPVTVERVGTFGDISFRPAQGGVSVAHRSEFTRNR